MSRKTFFVLGIFSFILITTLYYNSVYLLRESSIPHKIKTEISGLSSVNFDELVTGDWNNIVVVSPYTDSSEIKKQYNINFSRIANKSIEYGDGQSLIIFCEENKVESYFYIPYQVAVIDYSKLPKTQRIERENSIFAVERKNNGESITILSYTSK
ncbi:hypothetical protein SAMN02745784_02243 [Tissierella praeacuta DSM 18095]|uniref:Uncharacterized protein n=1 Tax=Tissierella praeacuta DSM 18095 TaxID=1123404 RepID=A0A1M4XGD0_9FIRM|nr:hypothetical protein [Tissierella praeacuta]TCU67795.1 hypothetical protein EV204_11139 [Tissierella praeacuta]SHE92549.1 hypothetical protein SAMN02745784_02243 [Tissierella praeacuta DSM 18095]SUP02152.1 Uncharacterised protein [Tissierella praeacuta]